MRVKEESSRNDTDGNFLLTDPGKNSLLLQPNIQSQVLQIKLPENYS